MAATFDTLERQFNAVPADVVQLLSEIDRLQGREEAFQRQHPEALRTLTEIARVQSTEASNAIENITAPRSRIEKLMDEKTTPSNRSEAEIAGYRYVLDLIHANVPNIPFRWNVVLQFHKDLYRFTQERNAGRTKITDNVISDKLPDGTEYVRFTPVPAGDAERFMKEIHEQFSAAWDAGAHHKLLLVSAYLFDFTAVHPFQDGNGRMSRLLTLLLLYNAGYDVGRYISVERVIAESKETYYESLQKAGIGWHDGEHDIYPWVRYFLGVLIGAYKEFEERVNVVQTGRGAKSEAVKQFLRSTLSDEFSFADIRTACPSVSDPTIRAVLKTLKERGAVESQGTGRSAKWKRLNTDF